MNELEGIQILVVDDNEDICELIEMQFEMAGLKVLKAFSGHQAMGLLNKNQNVKIVLSDTNMPDGNGEELLASCMQIEVSKRPLFYFITGDSEFSQEKVQVLGADGVFSKPFDMEKILETIKVRFKGQVG